MSAITMDTPGVRAAASLAMTWSQLVTSISAGRTTMTGVASVTCSPILQANTTGSHSKTKRRQPRPNSPSDPPAQSQDDDDDDHDEHYRAESDIHISSSL